MVSIAAFGPRDPGSNPGWFAVSEILRMEEDHLNIKIVQLC